jgi:hypothetical protein
MLVRKILILSTCFGFALLDYAGVASAAEETSPIRLTTRQMDKVTAGTAAGQNPCTRNPARCLLVQELGGTPMPPPIVELPSIVELPLEIDQITLRN